MAMAPLAARHDRRRCRSLRMPVPNCMPWGVAVLPLSPAPLYCALQVHHEFITYNLELQGMAPASSGYAAGLTSQMVGGARLQSIFEA